ncbi:protein DpdD [Nonomuraea sp. NPDC050536]|uniref:protein DpdD n=1 Tax=Nonomuraea sp. NPDC050536 TaxID=3364366 RepID=UPI0037CBC581
MNPALPNATWAKFVATFFSPPNEISATGNEAVERIVAQAEASWLASPASPIVLPVHASSWTYWYVICSDQDQRLWVRDLIQAYVGSWTDFSGQPVPRDSDLPLDQAVRTLTGPQGLSYRLLIPRDSNAEARVRQSLARMTRSLTVRPYRRISLALPLGRLIGDFSDSCASGSEARTEEILNLLEKDHRLSRANKLFLRLQYLATFEQWDLLKQFDELPDLIRLDRPILASDALARLAMARLPDTADIAEFVQATSAFGCLLGSATMIRSAAGAQYYAYWALSSGEPAEVVAARLHESGWLEQANGRSGLAALLSLPDTVDRAPTGEPDLAELQLALDGGRLDAAIDVLALVPPSATYLPVLLELVTKTLSNRSIQLLQRWRERLGESEIQDILSGPLTTSGHQVAIAAEPLGVALKAAFADSIGAAERARTTAELRAQAVPRLMQAGVLGEVVDVARPLSRSVDSSLLPDLIELLLDMERDLFLATNDVVGIQDLRLTIVEAWALGDESGDRHRANRLLDLVGRTLTTGVSPAIFDELVESLRAGWTPFLTDANLSLGLEAIEMLVAARPDTAMALQTFATQILSRIGPHNARRIDAILLETARMLASDFELELAIPSKPIGQTPNTAVQVSPPDGSFVAIYSLVESAANRAAAIVRHWYPDIHVETFADTVASAALRNAAKQADILVIADRAATHSATDALKKARGRKPIHYALGKGSASLVEAVLTGFDAIFGGTPSIEEP